MFGYASTALRDRPFKLKGVGLWFVWGNNFLSANLMGQKFPSLTWEEKNILNIIMHENNNVAKTNFLCAAK